MPAAAPDAAPATNAVRLLSAVLLLELIWLLLVASALVFLSAHLGSGTDELTGDAVSRRLLLVTVPPITVVVGLALIGARQAIDHRALSPAGLLSRAHRTALWVTAVANGALVVSIATSLYHARTTWLVVGIAMAAAFAAVATACIRAARP
jgi:hypothetical protein